MKALVTGGNGLLGSNVINELVKRNFAVRALLRKNKTLPNKHKNIELFYGNLTDKKDLFEAVNGCDIVIHIAAKTSQNSISLRAYEAVNVKSTKHILEAVNQFKLKRLILVSSANTFAYGSIEQPGNEGLPYSYPFTKSCYAQSKFEAQQLALHYSFQSSTSVIVVNPTFMLGKYDSKPSSGTIILRAYQRRLIFIPPGGKNFVHAKDVANSICNAITKGQHKQCYLLSGENLTYKTFYKKMCAITGQKSWIITIPSFFLKLVGIMGSGLIGLGIKNKFHYNNMAILCVRNYYDHSKAKQELSFQNTPINSAIKDAIDWFRAANKIKF